MNVATRGYGKRSGMLSSMGYGRRVIVFVEQIGVYIMARNRVWAVDGPARRWSLGAIDRIWTALAGGRKFVLEAGIRVWQVSGLRTFYLSVNRIWTALADRSWSKNDGD